MQVKQITELQDYLELLRENPDEIQALFGDLLISVTTFFRDPAAFEALEKLVIPHLFEGKDSSSVIRVWAPGCATGEEAYSIAMLLMEEAARRNVRPQIQIFATDIDASALNTAREGRYPAAIEADVSEERLSRFFILEKDRYQVKRELRDRFCLRVHNLTNDPPFSRLAPDLMPQRAHLFRSRSAAAGLRHFQLRALSRRISFHGRLRERGFTAGCVPPVDRDARIYQSTGNLPAAACPAAGIWNDAARCAGSLQSRKAMQRRWAAPPHKLALEELAPPSVLVDSSYRILHCRNRLGGICSFPAGRQRQCQRPHKAGAEARPFVGAEPGIRTAACLRYRAGHGEVQWQPRPWCTCRCGPSCGRTLRPRRWFSSSRRARRICAAPNSAVLAPPR